MPPTQTVSYADHLEAGGHSGGQVFARSRVRRGHVGHVGSTFFYRLRMVMDHLVQGKYGRNLHSGSRRRNENNALFSPLPDHVRRAPSLQQFYIYDVKLLRSQSRTPPRACHASGAAIARKRRSLATFATSVRFAQGRPRVYYRVFDSPARSDSALREEDGQVGKFQFLFRFLKERESEIGRSNYVVNCAPRTFETRAHTIDNCRRGEEGQRGINFYQVYLSEWGSDFTSSSSRFFSLSLRIQKRCVETLRVFVASIGSCLLIAHRSRAHRQSNSTGPRPFWVIRYTGQSLPASYRAIYRYSAGRGKEIR